MKIQKHKHKNKLWWECMNTNVKVNDDEIAKTQKQKAKGDENIKTQMQKAKGDENAKT